MKKGIFLLILLGIIAAGSLGTVYQHNRIVTLLYERRRVEMKKEQLGKQIASLQVELSRLHDYTLTKSIAMHQVSMRSLKFDQVVTMTHNCTVFS